MVLPSIPEAQRALEKFQGVPNIDGLIIHDDLGRVRNTVQSVKNEFPIIYEEICV